MFYFVGRFLVKATIFIVFIDIVKLQSAVTGPVVWLVCVQLSEDILHSLLLAAGHLQVE